MGLTVLQHLKSQGCWEDHKRMAFMYCDCLRMNATKKRPRWLTGVIPSSTGDTVWGAPLAESREQQRRDEEHDKYRTYVIPTTYSRLLSQSQLQCHGSHHLRHGWLPGCPVCCSFLRKGQYTQCEWVPGPGFNSHFWHLWIAWAWVSHLTCLKVNFLTHQGWCNYKPPASQLWGVVSSEK